MNYVKYDTEKQRQIQKVRTPDGKEQEIDLGEISIGVASCPKCGRIFASQAGMIGSRLQEAIGERKFLCECGEICCSMPVINMNKEDVVVTEVESDGEGETDTDNKDTN